MVLLKMSRPGDAVVQEVTLDVSIDDPRLVALSASAVVEGIKMEVVEI